MGKSNATDEDKLHHFMFALAIFMIILITIGSLSLRYQLQRLQRLRRMHRSHTEKHSVARQRNSVEELKMTALQSRKLMHQDLEEEMKELKCFQEELWGQLKLVKNVMSKKGIDDASVEQKSVRKALKKEQ
jgi:hypothetical protein